MSLVFRVRSNRPGLKDDETFFPEIYEHARDAKKAAEAKAFRIARSLSYDISDAYVQQCKVQSISYEVDGIISTKTTEFFGVFRRGWFGDKLVRRVWVDEVRVK